LVWDGSTKNAKMTSRPCARNSINFFWRGRGGGKSQVPEGDIQYKDIESK
jgi:hypothetical protein